MVDYALHDRDDGTVELVEMTPRIIATFSDRAHAERYYNILSETGIALPAGANPEPPREPKPVSAAAKAEVTPFRDLSPKEWQEACETLDAGGDMKELAKHLGVNFNKLRGKYAAWCRRKGEASQAAAPVEMEECRLCGREFKPTAENTDLCARCSRG